MRELIWSRYKAATRKAGPGAICTTFVSFTRFFASITIAKNFSECAIDPLELIVGNHLSYPLSSYSPVSDPRCSEDGSWFSFLKSLTLCAPKKIGVRVIAGTPITKC